MKHTIESFPMCEKCEVFTKPELRTSMARATFCEGLRAVGNCPKDLWAKESKDEIQKLIIHIQTVEIVKVMKENPDNHVDVAFHSGRVSSFKELLGEDKPE